MDFFYRILELTRKKGMTGSELCNVLDLNKSAFTNWKKGTLPTLQTALKLAEFFHVSVEYLATGNDPNGLTDDERDCVGLYTQLNEHDKKTVASLMLIMAHNTDEI